MELLILAGLVGWFAAFIAACERGGSKKKESKASHKETEACGSGAILPHPPTPPAVGYGLPYSRPPMPPPLSIKTKIDERGDLVTYYEGTGQEIMRWPTYLPPEENLPYGH